MCKVRYTGKINVKFIIILIVIVVAIGFSFFAAREANRAVSSKRNLDEGQIAFGKQEWAKAAKRFQKYLRYNPSDIDTLKKYAEAHMSIRPLEVKSISSAISAYRRIIQVDSENKKAYEKLAELYTIVSDYDELAYISKMFQKNIPSDPNAKLWLARSQIGLRKYEEVRKTLKSLINTLDELPQKPEIYIEACSMANQASIAPTSGGTIREALDYLDYAVDAFPQSVEALAARAQFYRQTTAIPGLSKDEKLERARQDMRVADEVDTENLRMKLFLASEWIKLNEPDKAEAELKSVENVSEGEVYEYFSDMRDWTVNKFLLISQVALQKKSAQEYLGITEEVLVKLTNKSDRMRILPSVVLLYLAADHVKENISKARAYLDEYMSSRYAQNEPENTKLANIYLQAMVANAEEKPYDVINFLQPAVVMDEARADLWKLMAQAYVETDQTRRAIDALKKYISIRPDDKDVILQLAHEYIKLQDWTRALETSRLAESLDTTDILIKLIFIEATIYHTVEQNYKVDPSKFESVSNELLQLRQEYPDRADIRILQAILADNLLKPEEAEKELKLAIQECKDTLRAEMLLVSHYYRNKKMTEAVEVCKKACDNHETVAEPWLVLSNIYVNMNDYKSAESTLANGIEHVTSKLQLRSLMIQRALVELLYIDRAKGIKSLTEVAMQDTQEIRARTLLLNIAEIQQNKPVFENQPTAQELIQQLKLAEGDSGLYWRIYQATLWLSADNWRSIQNDIITILQECVDRDPQWSSPVILLARLYEKMGSLSHMEDVCRKALDRNPSATDVADILISLLENQGRFSDAQEILSEVETNARLSSAWNVRIAVNSGDFSRAIQELMLRVSNDDNDANSRILLARLLYWQNRDAQQAFDLLNEVESISPDSIALFAAKVAILRAEGRSYDAQQILDEYVSHNNSFAAYAMRANYLSNIGDSTALKAAEEDYRRLTKFADNSIEGYQMLSNFYTNNNKLDEAIATLEEGLEANPDNVSLKRKLVRVLFTRNLGDDQEKALEILTALQKKLPDDPGLIGLEALYILQKPTPDNIKIARKKLEEVIKLEPTAVDAHLALIDIALGQQRYGDARDSAILAIGYNPNYNSFVTARAKAELKLGDSQLALELALQVLQEEPGNFDALTIITEVNNRSFIDKAVTLIESANIAEPTDLNILISLSRIYAQQGRHGLAINKIQEYIQSNKENKNISAFVTLADLYRMTGYFDKAEEQIEQAHKINPKSLEVIHSRLLLLIAQKKYDKLSQIGELYLSADKPKPSVLMAAGTELMSIDSAELKNEAKKLFEQVLKYDLVSKDDQMNLANALYQLGDADFAITKYKELIQQYPDDIFVLNNLAWILQEHEKLYDDSLNLVNRALKISPDDINLLDTKAMILSNIENRLEEARKEYEKIVEITDSESQMQANALARLGQISYELKDFPKAEQYLQDALEINQTINIFSADQVSDISKTLQTIKNQSNL